MEDGWMVLYRFATLVIFFAKKISCELSRCISTFTYMLSMKTCFVLSLISGVALCLFSFFTSDKK